MNMYRNLSIFMATLFACGIHAVDNNKALILGTMQFPRHVQCPIEKLHVLYEGEEYAVQTDRTEKSYANKGYFEMYEQADIDCLYVLITEYLKLPDQNDFTHFQTSPDHKHVLFKLMRKKHTNEDEQEVVSWQVEQMPDEKMRTVPDKTIMLFMPPEYIQTLEAKDMFCEDNIIRLPKIVFKDDISEQEFKETTTKMILALLDFKSFHKKDEKRMMLVAGNRLVTIPYPSSKI